MIRSRLAVSLACLVVLAVLPANAWASPDLPLLAQQPGEDPDTEGGEGQDPEGEGQGDPEAETGANEGQGEEATPEPGPPWTYQMARIALVLLALTLVAVFLAYQRFVIRRRRGFA